MRDVCVEAAHGQSCNYSVVKKCALRSRLLRPSRVLPHWYSSAESFLLLALHARTVIMYMRKLNSLPSKIQVPFHLLQIDWLVML